MNLTPELVNAYKEELNIESDFTYAETVTANHELYAQWKERKGLPNFPKILFYIIMNETYGHSHAVNEKGLLGRNLTVKS